MTQLSTTRHSPAFSIPSILAMVAVVLMFVTPYTFILGIVAILFGLLGVVLSISPMKRGGILSFLAIGLGVIAIIVSIIRLIAGTGATNTTY